MSSGYYLPDKIVSYLKRLDLEYARSSDTLYQQIIRESRVSVIAGTEFDNWNGGTYGHGLVFFLPDELIAAIPLAAQKEITDKLKSDLAVCTEAIPNEYFSEVRLE
ncbi:MAG: hypothetical protein ABJ388_06630 [Alphaproteobacteria bacterium]